MKTVFLMPLLLVAAVCSSGCRSYQYRIVQPAGGPSVVGKEPAIIKYDPLEYRLARRHDRLDMRIINPTNDRISVEGQRSYVVDPHGESHPVRGKVIGPHSYTQIFLPPIPATYPYGWDAWGPGWGWSFGWGLPGPYWDPFWGAMYIPPPSYYQVMTPYDWEWKEGPVRLHISYERKDAHFEHDFEFVREKEPKR